MGVASIVVSHMPLWGDALTSHAARAHIVGQIGRCNEIYFIDILKCEHFYKQKTLFLVTVGRLL